MTFFANPCSARPVLPDTDVTTPLTQAERDYCFREGRLPLGPRVFGLAIVLGGTVSAGAYTAGVLDFLMEALDEWESARERDPNAEQHKVELTIVTGSSGGGVCGGILSKALGFIFPHVRRDPHNASRNEALLLKPAGLKIDCNTSDNPFWDVWVEKLRIGGLLQNENGDESLLDATPINEAAKTLAAFPGTTPLPPADRKWVHEYFNLVLGLTNLRGIPTKIDFDSGSCKVSQSFVERSDFVRFGVAATSGDQRRRIGPRCDEMALLGPSSPPADWGSFVEYAKATGAFPGGFPARFLSRCITDYRFRPVVFPGDSQEGQVEQFPVDGAALKNSGIDLAGKYDFVAVDAGATDNAPVELARRHLSGLLGRNPRDANSADRAVLLIDPFAERAEIEPAQKAGILGTILSLLMGLVAESRYHTRDLLLAANNKVYSRFMLTAARSRPGSSQPSSDLLVGGKAICSSRLGAFFGFFHREYSIHDYFLGRKNCQDFLINVLVLSDNNPLFEVPPDLQTGKAKQVLPLYGTASQDQTEPVWPDFADFKPETLKEPLKKRLKTVLDGLTSSMGFWTKVLILILAPLGVLLKPIFIGQLAKYLVKTIQGGKDGNSTVGIPKL
jgi:hypothetical protein